jgi:uncharacterized protein YunC (DUF1805 family)
MLKSKKSKTVKKSIEAVLIPLSSKNLIMLRGSRGYVMCGYLNLKVAQKFNDVAIKIVGVSSIQDALKAKAHSCTSAARKLGIHKGQPIKEVLKLIA